MTLESLGGSSGGYRQRAQQEQLAAEAERAEKPVHDVPAREKGDSASGVRAAVFEMMRGVVSEEEEASMRKRYFEILEEIKEKRAFINSSRDESAKNKTTAEVARLLVEQETLTDKMKKAGVSNEKFNLQ